MKRSGPIRVLQTAALALALLAGATQAAWCSNVAAWLPDDVVAYAELRDLPKLHGALVESGLARRIAMAIGPESEPQVGLMVQSLIAALSTVDAVHLSLHDLKVYRRRTDVRILLVAEGKKDGWVAEWLQAFLAPMLTGAGEYRGVPLQALRNAPLARLGVEVLIAAVGNRLIAATDRLVLEDFLDTLHDGRVRSLAENSDYRRVTQRRGERELLVYISGDRVRYVVSRLQDLSDSRETQAVNEAFDLERVRCVAYAVGYDRSVDLIRMVVDPESRALAIVAQPPRRHDEILQRVPGGAWLAISGAVTDPADTWKRLDHYLAVKLSRIGEVGSRGHYYQVRARAEEELGARFGDLAAATTGGLAVFWQPDPDGRLDDDEAAFLATIRDPVEAERLLTVIQVASGGEVRVEELEGIPVTVAETRRGLSWAIVDGLAAFGPSAEAVKSAVLSGLGRSHFTDHSGYEGLAAKLHPESAWVAALDLDAVGRKAGGPRETAPYPIRNLFSGQMIGASARVDGGVIEARIGYSPGLGLVEIFRAVSAVLRGAGE